MESIMVSVTLPDFMGTAAAKADLGKARSLVASGKEYCPDAIKIVLGLPTGKKE